MRDGWSQDEEKKLMRWVDWRLIPVLFICATLSGLDKTAISAAAIYNLRDDLNLTGAQYSWVGSAPFFGGLAFMGPSAYCLQRLPSVQFFAFNVLCWGIMEMRMAECRSFGGLFYRTEEQPKRNNIILNVIAPILNGLIAWVCGYHTVSFPTWKIIFLLLGLVTTVWAGVVYFCLPDDPLDAPWLSQREKYIVVARKASDRGNTDVEGQTVKREQISEAFADAKSWLIWFAIVALQVPNCGLTTFNTLIISGLGFDALQTSLLAMPPGAMGTISGILLSFLAATTRRYRTALVAASILLPLLGAVLCYALPRDNLAGQLVGLYILYTYWAPYVTLVSVYQANIAGYTKKTVLYAWSYIAWAVGNIIGPQTFRKDQAPVYTGGTVAMIVCYGIAITAISMYGVLCHKENKKRQVLGEPMSGQDWLDLTDKQNIGFRYTT
ncbi:hypothetical protein BDW74DRAFT_168546 [Aspergillus multicolor]|uniref:uncharacterized protein n=1 Tax=Aspergillus multicolor TaxID=41759 RepID=UPI003CCDBA37